MLEILIEFGIMAIFMGSIISFALWFISWLYTPEKEWVGKDMYGEPIWIGSRVIVKAIDSRGIRQLRNGFITGVKGKYIEVGRYGYYLKESLTHSSYRLAKPSPPSTINTNMVIRNGDIKV